MHMKHSLTGSPLWVRTFLLVLTAVTVLTLGAVGTVGYRQGQQLATVHRADALADLRDQLETRIQAGDLPVAIQIGEHLESLGALQEAERRNVQQLRERRTAQLQAAAVSAPLPEPEPMQPDHELWQAALAAHARAEWATAIEHLRALKQVDRQYVTVPYMELLEDAYIQWARSLVMGHTGEQAIVLLEVAWALRQNEEIRQELQAANLIVNSQSSWGVDWPSTFDALIWVYRYDPHYPGLQEMLSQAFEHYKEGALYRGSTCEAFLYLGSEQMQALLATLHKESVSVQLRRACEVAIR